MKKCFMVLLVILFFTCFTTALWAGQKYSLKSEKALNKLSLGKLVQTCSGLKIIQTPSATPEPIKLNAELPQPKCHYQWGYWYGKWGYMCVDGPGPFECPCEDLYIPN